jgi:Icc-related predicted phosphoesterase
VKFIYATDLHGDTRKYDAILKYAMSHDIKYIHIGADILPKGTGILKTQKRFVQGFLKDFYKRCEEEGIRVLAMFGNDDIYTRKKYFKKYGKLLDDKPELIEGYTFTGYPYVPDYPFGLVTACKYDYTGWEPEPYFGRKVDVDDTGFVDIPDPLTYFNYKGTIKEDLDNISADMSTVIAIHCPPCSLGMDICLNGKKVGSKSIYEWIEKEQPRLVLSGHIHESRHMSGTWKAEIGASVVLQPGQFGSSTNAVIVNLTDEKDEYTSVIL